MVIHLSEGLYEPLSGAVAAGRYDFAITTRPTAPISADLSAKLLFKDQFVFAGGANHPLAKQITTRRRKIEPSDLLEYPFVLPPRGGILWPRFVEVFERLGLQPPRPQVETNSAGCMIAMLRTGADPQPGAALSGRA